MAELTVFRWTNLITSTKNGKELNLRFKQLNFDENEIIVLKGWTVTQHHHVRARRNQLYSFGPDANKNNKNLQMILQCCNNLASQSAAALQQFFCTFGHLCWALPVVRLPCTPVSTGQKSSLMAASFPSGEPPLLRSVLWKQDNGGHVLHNGDLWASQQAWISELFPITGTDWQISVLLVYVTGDECHVESKTFILFFSLTKCFRPLMWVNSLSSTTTITKTKERREHPNYTPSIIKTLRKAKILDCFLMQNMEKVGFYCKTWFHMHPDNICH